MTTYQVTREDLKRLTKDAHADGVRVAVELIREKRGTYTIDDILAALEQTANLRDPQVVMEADDDTRRI